MDKDTRQSNQVRAWQCKSRLMPSMPSGCPHKCQVMASFEPRGCLWAALYQDWQLVENLDAQSLESAGPCSVSKSDNQGKECPE